MNQLHQQLLTEIRKRQSKSKWANINRYLGTPNYVYGVKSAGYQKIIKEWKLKNPDISDSDFFEFLDSLNQGKSVEEKIFVGSFLSKFPERRKKIDLKYLDKWFGNVNGWVEVDTLSGFGAEEMLGRWNLWKELLERFVKDKNINKRRASVVLLTKPVRESADSRLSDLAFENVQLLKGEKDILITKAISWILRSLIKFHREEVEEYLEKNKTLLPKIALRETRRKLLTGKK